MQVEILTSILIIYKILYLLFFSYYLLLKYNTFSFYDSRRII